jgi:hypothetical protein
MDTSKLFRKPLTDRKWDDPGEVTLIISPDKKHKIAFSHFFEVSMGSYQGLFSLMDEADNIIDGFEPLTTANSYNCYWKDDSTIFTLICDDFAYGYLFVRIADLSLSFVKIVYPHPSNINVLFKNDMIVFSYDDHQLSLKNSVQTFGGGLLEIPSKVYLKPKDIEIPFDELTFFPRKDLQNLKSLTQNDREYRLDPIDGGYREFTGTFPQATDQLFNSRHLDVYQLEAFAEYGDEQSLEWLEAIKAKTGGKYNKWAKVTDYIGVQKRGRRWRKA